MCRLFNHDEYEQSYAIAIELFLQPELPLPIRATCYTLLGTSNDVNFLAFAAESVTVWESILQAVEKAHRVTREGPSQSLLDELAVARAWCKRKMQSGL